jgi:hypothetical protein
MTNTEGEAITSKTTREKILEALAEAETRSMTREEYEAFGNAICEMVLDEMVENGIFRVSHIDEKGRKVYVETDAARHHKNLHVIGPNTEQ